MTHLIMWMLILLMCSLDCTVSTGENWRNGDIETIEDNFKLEQIDIDNYCPDDSLSACFMTTGCHSIDKEYPIEPYTGKEKFKDFGCGVLIVIQQRSKNPTKWRVVMISHDSRKNSPVFKQHNITFIYDDMDIMKYGYFGADGQVSESMNSFWTSMTLPFSGKKKFRIADNLFYQYHNYRENKKLMIRFDIVFGESFEFDRNSQTGFRLQYEEDGNPKAISLEVTIDTPKVQWLVNDRAKCDMSLIHTVLVRDIPDDFTQTSLYVQFHPITVVPMNGLLYVKILDQDEFHFDHKKDEPLEFTDYERIHKIACDGDKFSIFHIDNSAHVEYVTGKHLLLHTRFPKSPPRAFHYASTNDPEQGTAFGLCPQRPHEHKDQWKHNLIDCNNPGQILGHVRDSLESAEESCGSLTCVRRICKAGASQSVLVNPEANCPTYDDFQYTDLQSFVVVKNGNAGCCPEASVLITKCNDWDSFYYAGEVTGCPETEQFYIWP